MTNRPQARQPAPSSRLQQPDRPVRADARRNRDRVLATAQELFARDGLEVSLDEIARSAGVGPGTVHRHFPKKEDLYLAVAINEIEGLVAHGDSLLVGDDPAAVFTMLSRMITTGAKNVAVKSALEASELDLRAAAPGLATDLTQRVADLLERAHAAGTVRDDVTADDLMALVAGAFAATRHANAQAGTERATHIANLILDGLPPRPTRSARSVHTATPNEGGPPSEQDKRPIA